MPTSAQCLLGPDGRVALNVPCLGCGYNLRTQLPDGICPECARRVADSIQPEFLRFASAEWVRGLARGLLILLITLGATVIASMLASAIVGATAVVPRPTFSAVFPGSVIVTYCLVQFFVHIAGLAVGLVGLFWLTRREPALPSQRDGLSARRVVRCGACLLPLPVVANLFLALSIPDLMARFAAPPQAINADAFIRPFTTFMQLSVAVAIGSVVVYGITLLALLRHLAHLLRRIPRPGLVTFAHIEFWGWLVSVPIALVGYALAFSAMFPWLPGMMSATSAAATSTPAPPTYTTWITSSGVTVTTPVRAGAPTTLATSRTIAPLDLGPFFVGGLIGAIGNCASAAFGVAALVLLILACVALFKAAREAGENAGLMQAPAAPAALGGGDDPAG